MSRNYYSPCDFTGSDTERIQQAVDAAAAGNGIARIFPKEDGSAYMLDSAILLPSHVTVFLENCRIKLSDSCRDNIFRSSNCGLNCGTVEFLEDIHLIGVGKVILEGADRPRSSGDSGKILGERTFGSDTGKEGLPQKGGWQNIGVLLVKVKDFTLENFTVREPHCWSISLEYCSFGNVKNIHFESTGVRVIDGVLWKILNQDGLDLRRGCHDITIESISGWTGDDLVALTALRAKERPAGIPESTEMCGAAPTLEEEHVYNITIHNINGCSACGHNIVRFLNAKGIKMHHITLMDLMDTSCSRGLNDYAAVRIGDENPAYGIAPMGDTAGFLISNIQTRTKHGIRISGSLSESIISRVINYNPETSAVTYSASREENTRNVIIESVVDCF